MSGPNHVDNPERASRAAHTLASHMFGATVGIAARFTPMLEAAVGELPLPEQINLILEPLFLSVVRFRTWAGEFYDQASLQVFVQTIDEVLLYFLTEVYFHPESETADPTSHRAPVDHQYRTWVELRAHQYTKMRGSIALSIYRFFKGERWLDALFLRQILIRDFADGALAPPPYAFQLFSDAIVADIYSQRDVIRSGLANS